MIVVRQWLWQFMTVVSQHMWNRQVDASRWPRLSGSLAAGPCGLTSIVRLTDISFLDPLDINCWTPNCWTLNCWTLVMAIDPRDGNCWTINCWTPSRNKSSWRQLLNRQLLIPWRMSITGSAHEDGGLLCQVWWLACWCRKGEKEKHQVCRRQAEGYQQRWEGPLELALENLGSAVATLPRVCPTDDEE